MLLNSEVSPRPRFARACIVVAVFTTILHAAESNERVQSLGKANKKPSDKRVEFKYSGENRLAKSLSGRWTVVEEVQEVFDDISPTPSFQGGRVKEIGIRVIDLQEFWKFRQVKQIEDEISEVAAKSLSKY